MTRKISDVIYSNRDTIAKILILISLLMLFLPWLSVYVTISGTRYTLADILEISDVSPLEIQREVAEMVSDAQEFGIHLDGSSIIRVVNYLRNSAFSPFQLIRFMSSCRKLTGLLEKAAVFLDGMAEASMFREATSGFVAFEIFLLICLIVVIAAGIALLLKRFRDNRKLLWLYFGCSIALFAFFAVLTVVLNSKCRDASSILNEVFSYSSNGKTSATPFHITFWSFLFLLSATGAAVLGIFSRGDSVERGAAGSFFELFHSLFRGWSVPISKCPYCGKLTKGNASFCQHCGNRLRVEPSPFVICVNCGAKVDKGAAFCPSCGKDPGRKVEPPEQFINCVNCGAKVRKGAAACPSCGKDPIRKVEPPEQFINCVNCGAKVRKGTAACPSCGKNPSFVMNFFSEPKDL